MKEWILSCLKRWGILTGAKSANTPSTTISQMGKPSLTVSSQNGTIPHKVVILGERRISLLRPFPKEIVISSSFGEREIDGKKEIHYGYDFKTPVGTVVRACHDGAVFRAGWQNEYDHSDGFGYRLWQEIEEEGYRFYIFYAHLSKIFVEEGARIHRGEEVALTGNSGRTTGPHCHVECRLKDSKDRFEIDWLDV